MTRLFLAVTVLLLLPVVVFVGGAWIMSTVSGRHTVRDQKPLNQRLGYDTKAVDRYWRELDTPARRRAEQRFLELDLVFPVCYGTALVVSLLTASAILGRPVRAAWLIVPVVVTVAADWVENLVQLDQLRSYINDGEKGLVPGWIHVASTATTVKLAFPVVLFIFPTLLVVLGGPAFILFFKSSIFPKH